MASKYPVPAANQFVALSCSNVGVGPGGTVSHYLKILTDCPFIIIPPALQTSMLAYVNESRSNLYLRCPQLISRVSIVDYTGQVIFDAFVAPTMQVIDYRTATTGIEPHHLTSSQSNSLVRPLFHL